MTRAGATHSIFGEGRFVLGIAIADLDAGALVKAQLLFVSGT